MLSSRFTSDYILFSVRGDPEESGRATHRGDPIFICCGHEPASPNINKGKKYVVAVESKSLKARILDLLQRASARTRNSHDHSPISNVNH